MFKYTVFGEENYFDKNFDKHFYLFSYEGLIRDIVLKYKFNEKAYLYLSLIDFFKKNKKRYIQFEFYDIILAVPISKKRKKQRGYNQSYLISKEIAKIYNLEIAKNVLIKTKNNQKQSLLDKNKRMENVKGVYRVTNTKKVINKDILLVDDIYTTGATLNECSKILKNAGARHIDVFTIAKN